MNERDIFIEARHIPENDARNRYLEEVCGGEADLRRRVENLLQADDRAGSFLAAPAAAFQPTAGATQINDALGTQIGPYKLLQQIGEGGMGTVFMAEQTEPVKRLVAVKLIKAGMDSRQFIARFEAERQALAMMDHPNIARVLDAGTTSAGRPYFVMDLVRGAPITRYCDEHQLTPRQRLELFIPVCQAIQHAHQKGIIHRDLKPTNVLVAIYDGKPVPKVIDFGVAKATGQTLTDKTLVTGFGNIVGTLEYMSPEQAETNQLDIDTRSDIYSLGVLLYELLTGSTPFSRKDLEQAGMLEMLRVIREDEPSKPSTKLSTAEGLPTLAANRGTEPAKLTKLVRGELDWIVMKALEKDRSRRYETANGFAMDVQRYMADEPVQACPPSTAYRFGKFARRNRGALAIASVAALAMLLVLVGLTVSNVLITHEKDLKVAALQAANTQKGIAERNALKAHEQEQIAVANEKRAKESELLANRRYYAAQMNLAMQAWHAGEMPRVLELLEGQRPADPKDDLRGFEWFYLWRLCQGGRRVPIRGHDRAALGLAFSPDGKMLASASWDWTVRLWDTATGKEQKVLRGDQGPWEVAFSPDGKTLASSGQEAGSMVLWDVDAGKPLHTIAGSVEGLRFTPDGKSVVGSQYNGRESDNTGKFSDLKTWDVASGKEQVMISGAGILAGFETTQGTLVTLANRYLPDSEIRVWDWPGGKRRLTIPADAPKVALSPDGSQVAATTSGAIKLWNAKTGDLLLALPTDGVGRGLAFSPDGKRIACGLENRRVVVYDIETGKRIAEDVHLDPVWGLAFSPDSKSLASSTLSGAIKLWDLTPAEEAATLSGIEPNPGLPEATGQCLRFTSDGKALLVGHRGLTKVIDVVAGEEIAVLPASRIGAISADGNVLAGAGDSGFDLWDVRAGRQLPAVLFPKDAKVRTIALLSTDGGTLASFQPWGSDNMVTLRDVATRRSRVLSIPPPESNAHSVLSADFSRDGKLLAAGYLFQWVVVWDLATAKVKLKIYQQPGMMTVYSVAFSPDCKSLAVGTNAGAVTLWDLDNGKQRVAFRGHTSFIHALAFSPDGGTLATAGADRTVRLWDVITGQERGTLVGHTGPVTNVSFSPDGFTLATASQDGTVKLWQGATDFEATSPRKAVFSSDTNTSILLPPGAITRQERVAELLNKRAAVDKEDSPLGPWTQWNRAAEHLRIAVALRDLDSLAEAESTCHLALSGFSRLEKEPHILQVQDQLGWTLNLLADVLMKLGRPDEALPMLREALAHFRVMALDRPDAPEYREAIASVCAQLGSQLQRTGKLEEAVEVEHDGLVAKETERNVRTLPRPDALMLQAKPFAEKRDWKQAAAELDKGFEGETRTDPTLCYAVALARLLSGDVDGYARVIEHKPKLPLGYEWPGDFVRARILHPRGVVDAESLLRFAQAAYDQERHSWNIQNLGMLEYRTGKFEQAQAHIEEALELADWHLFWPTLAMCHHQLGHAEQARKWLDKTNEHFCYVTEINRDPLQVTEEPFWEDWAYFEVMRREANALIDGKK